MKKIVVLLVLVFTLFAVLTPVVTVSAAELNQPIADDPPPDGLFDPVTEFVQEIAVGILRAIYFIGGVTLIIGVAMATLRTNVGLAVGNSMGVSQGIVSIAMAFATFLGLLLAVPTANRLILTMADRISTSVAMDSVKDTIANLPEGQITGGSVDPTHFLEAAEEPLLDLGVSIARAAITIGGIAGVVASALGMLDSQIGSVLGSGMRVSAGIMRTVGAFASIVLALVAVPAAEAFIRSVVPRVLPAIEIVVPNF